jgi:predicted nucleic acid-binding protein
MAKFQTLLVTQYVVYEALFKPRKSDTKEDLELKQRFKASLEDTKFEKYSIEVEDLQEFEVSNTRKKLGRGEISCYVLAKKFRICVLTDDQLARKFCSDNHVKCQTIPHLLGWLFFHNYLSDADVDEIIVEHNSFKRPLEKFFIKIRDEALMMKLAGQSKPNN